MNEKRSSDRDWQIDEALDQSFPASDPPYFVGAGAKSGAPIPQRKQAGDGRQFGTSSYLAIKR